MISKGSRAQGWESSLRRQRRPAATLAIIFMFMADVINRKAISAPPLRCIAEPYIDADLKIFLE